MRCKQGHESGAGAAYCSTCGLELPSASSLALRPTELGDALRGQLLGERFRLLERIGEGGMGMVYVAEQALGITTRKVAIKLLWPSAVGDTTAKERFLLEAAVIAQLEHPNTVRVYDFGTTPEGMQFLVMEFLSGEPLSQLLRREGALGPARVDHISSQIAGSLDEAHARGIIHRDLKPGNVLLTEPGGVRDFVKLLDFGIAARAGALPGQGRLTEQGMVLGTPAYMSPEQFTGDSLGASSDIYSLGVTLYELLTGMLPFEAASVSGWAQAHQTAVPRPFAETERGRGVPAGVQSAVLWALAKQPARRPPSAGALHAALHAGLGSASAGGVSRRSAADALTVFTDPSSGPGAGASAGSARRGDAPTVLLGFGPPETEPGPAAPAASARTTAATSATAPSTAPAPVDDGRSSIPWPPSPPRSPPPRPWWARDASVNVRWVALAACVAAFALVLSRRGEERVEPGTPAAASVSGAPLPVDPAAPQSGAPDPPDPPSAPEPVAPPPKPAQPPPAEPESTSPEPRDPRPTPTSRRPESTASAPNVRKPPPAEPESNSPAPSESPPVKPKASSPVPPRTSPDPDRPEPRNKPPSPSTGGLRPEVVAVLDRLLGGLRGSSQGSSPSSRDGFAVGVRRQVAPGIVVQRVDTQGSSVRLRIHAAPRTHVVVDEHHDHRDEIDDYVRNGSLQVPRLEPGVHYLHACWPDGHRTEAEIRLEAGHLDVELRDPGR